MQTNIFSLSVKQLPLQKFTDTPFPGNYMYPLNIKDPINPVMSDIYQFYRWFKPDIINVIVFNCRIVVLRDLYQ